jgi:hypothetical protein
VAPSPCASWRTAAPGDGELEVFPANFFSGLKIFLLFFGSFSRQRRRKEGDWEDAAVARKRKKELEFAECW